MISQTRQRFAMGGMVVVAVLALALGAAYQDDNKLDEPRIVGGNSQTASADTDGGAGADAGGQSVAAAGAEGSAGAIEGFLPRSGEASACSEPIGVDLADGFGAKLTINGVDVAPEAMNVNLDEDGEISQVITASRSLGHYTFEPDDNCPNGTLLRPVGNVLEVCVYRLSDVSETCALRRENVFDAL